MVTCYFPLICQPLASPKVMVGHFTVTPTTCPNPTTRKFIDQGISGAGEEEKEEATSRLCCLGGKVSGFFYLFSTA
jgi:hypothetical protein